MAVNVEALRTELASVLLAARERFAVVHGPALAEYRRRVASAEADLEAVRREATSGRMALDEAERRITAAEERIEAAQNAAARDYAEAVRPAEREHTAAVRQAVARFERLEAMA